VRKGPTRPVLRIIGPFIGPFIVLSTIVLLGTGVLLALEKRPERYFGYPLTALASTARGSRPSPIPTSLRCGPATTASGWRVCDCADVDGHHPVATQATSGVIRFADAMAASRQIRALSSRVRRRTRRSPPDNPRGSKRRTSRMAGLIAGIAERPYESLASGRSTRR
jgi:hypothetical protein